CHLVAEIFDLFHDQVGTTRRGHPRQQRDGAALQQLPATDVLSQYLLTTTDDFVTTRDVTLAAESNSISASLFQPYLGDFFDLTGIGNTFYGIFSASNADNGFNALFANPTFNRSFVGTPGKGDFRLTDANGNPVPFSIDPFFFGYTI